MRVSKLVSSFLKVRVKEGRYSAYLWKVYDGALIGFSPHTVYFLGCVRGFFIVRIFQSVLIYLVALDAGSSKVFQIVLLFNTLNQIMLKQVIDRRRFFNIFFQIEKTQASLGKFSI